MWILKSSHLISMQHSGDLATFARLLESFSVIGESIATSVLDQQSGGKPCDTLVGNPGTYVAGVLGLRGTVRRA